ncbi:hypothetical protein COCSUDRAFT_38558 [Coccomyxa subellipsoidea C-169]|uniref:Uncharacterized protein n=1 Tax=Coccomyxa subellipsoidea (strain C-169) TaxID=574566 RepID=I0YK62_COCSC|nr:hypothetical protein COCSUDRAFT_38558 [Coccomyxa subellipsoidea C-169]EIE18781.1 hypothetical protein COCSUDRAFT_38558 [Coccomyxa subellipsoidea C-169]|eukprot:XP_005643325.1 hypothetical protein COCSUDRAFT_38558 [Coccomyxa subellipsoidea C-169]
MDWEMPKSACVWGDLKQIFPWDVCMAPADRGKAAAHSSIQGRDGLASTLFALFSGVLAARKCQNVVRLLRM